MPTETLTFPQRKAIGGLLRASMSCTAREVFTRRDVLWRLQERGLVERDLHDRWRATAAGRDAYERAMAALSAIEPTPDDSGIGGALSEDR